MSRQLVDHRRHRDRACDSTSFVSTSHRRQLSGLISSAKTTWDMTGPGRSVMVHIEGTRSLECTTPVQKMSGEGYLWTKFLPGILTQKEEMFRIIQTRGIQRPVMQIWGYNDPTVSLDQAMQLYRILAEKERRARWQVFNQSGHFSFREHPQRFNDILKSFIQAP